MLMRKSAAKIESQKKRMDYIENFMNINDGVEKRFQMLVLFTDLAL